MYTERTVLTYFCTWCKTKAKSLKVQKAWKYRLLIWNFNAISSCTLSDLCLDAEKQRSMYLVRVPLNVEHMLSGYQRAFERGRQCLLVFQRSHSLLLRHLADTQPCECSADGVDADKLWTQTCCLSPGFAAQLYHSEARCQVKFNLASNDSPNMQSCDLDEDLSKPSAVYKLPVSPEHMSTVTDAYSASISKHSNIRI